MRECVKGAWGWRKCHFEARYDLSPVDLSNVKYEGPDPYAFYEARRSKTYVRDVCVRCGKTIERGVK